ncbi:MAG: type II toxin-antitoxin system VapC family toxin [candidate division NC10 bacterium]|nr:type II toxin-antitoxin system VapC family toxin [candidate division NC10 bacterium]MBI4839603.1 type II toxin-antitoxin system VapC family toxin [candidate division NC10 bacterium]
MRRRSLLDSFAVLAWIQDESGADRVEGLLTEAQRHNVPLLLSVINLGEVYYRLARQHGHPFAQGVIRQLQALPLELYPCDEALALEAARIKADFPMAYADAIAVATAQRERAVIVTGDPEFTKVEHLVTVDWL